MQNYKKFQDKKHERKIFLKKKKKNIGFQRRWNPMLLRYPKVYDNFIKSTME